MNSSLTHIVCSLLLLTFAALPVVAGFVEVGSIVGVDYAGKGRSCAWGDYDGDGWLDLYLGNVGEDNVLYRNRLGSGSLPFDDVTTAMGVGNTAYDSWGVLFGDYDNDSDLDIYVANDFLDPCRLFRNDGTGFVNVAPALGLEGDENNMGIAWSDMDRDGDLDQYLSIWGVNHHYRSDGRDGFSDITSSTGTASQAIGFQPAWVDFDNDGDPDFFNANLDNLFFIDSQLFRNDGSHFTDISSAMNPLLIEEAVGASWADFDNDGDMDLFTARGTWTAFGEAAPNRLYRNDGTQFVDLAPMFAGMADTLASTSGIFADYDLDGDLDLIVNGNHSLQLFRNDSNLFVNVAASEGLVDTTNTGPSRGAVWADYDNDGDPDLYVVHRNGTNRLFRNDQTTGNNWITIKTVGTESNRDGIGAVVEVLSGGVMQRQEINSGDGHFSGQSLPLEFGMGSETQSTVTIHWPSGVEQISVNPTINSVLTFTETVPAGLLLYEDKSATLSLDDSGDGRGVAWGDFDGDLDLDLYVTNNGTNLLYRNDGGTFVEIAGLSGVADAGSNSKSALWIDYDNDGQLDLYVSNNGTDNRLYRNTGGSFTDMAAAAGITSANQKNWGAAWVDFDRDGDVDFFQARGSEPNSLYRNDGGLFVDLAPALAIDYPSGKERGVMWGDYDDDGWPDLFLVSKADNRLLKNNAGSGFTDMTVAAGVDDSGTGLGAAWGDWDNDGDLDLYLSNDGPNAAFENNGNGTFTPADYSWNLGYLGIDKGPVWVDFDEDSDLDLSLTAWGGWNRLLRNEGSTFRDGAVLRGVAHYGYTEGAGWADYDDDGDLDLFYACDGEANVFYEKSSTSGTNWLRIRLLGTVSNVAGIGAKIEVQTGSVTQTRYVTAGSGRFSQGELWPHLFLGGSTVAELITITWPSGIVDKWIDVAADQDRQFVEGDSDVGVEGGEAPHRFTLLGSRPNPFNPITRIQYEIPTEGHVSLMIFDTAGRRVRTLIDGRLAAGRHDAIWNGRDDRGQPVATGIYLTRLRSTFGVRTGKLALIR